MNAMRPFHLSIIGLCLIGTSACTFVWDKNVGKMTGPLEASVTGSQVPGGTDEIAVLGTLLERLSSDVVAGHLTPRDRHLMGTLASITLNEVADDDTRTWRNGASKHQGAFTVHSSWRTAAGIECRRFTNVVEAGEHEAHATGTACRQSDGTWTLNG